MGNFYADNDDLRFYVERDIDWGPMVDLTEDHYRAPDAFKDAASAVDTYREMLSMIGAFAADEIAPRAAAIDKKGLGFSNGEVVYPEEMTAIFDRIKELELHGMCVPREFGGMNIPLLISMLSSELIARADVSVMAHHGFHGGMAAAMMLYSIDEGTTVYDRQASRYVSTRWEKEIREIVRGESWGSMDITEPNAGSDMAALRTRAELDASTGQWFVSGEKIFITSGHGKYHFVIARTEDSKPSDSAEDALAGLRGLSLFMVPAYEDRDGRRVRFANVERIEEKLGGHASATCAVTFDRAPAQLIGKRGDGFRHMLLLMNGARVGVGFEALGLAEASYRLAKAYAAERWSMGKPIDQHEMIADYLDEMRTDIQGIRALAVHAAYNEELGQRMRSALKLSVEPGSLEAKRIEREVDRVRSRARRVTPLLKYVASEKAVEIARRAIQILGGVGYTREFGAEKLLRDAVVMPIYEGTSQIQALMAMKDTLTGIIKNPQEFVTRSAQARWRSVSARDPLERRVARISALSLGAQQHLVATTARTKLRAISSQPLGRWPTALRQHWDPKRDFSSAMLHAERLIKLLVDASTSKILCAQAQRHPERRELLDRYTERAELRCRALHDEILSSGDRLLASLEVAEPEVRRA
jgi:alkylation response protein AidB-like acyl-CoA dehydrogenase